MNGNDTSVNWAADAKRVVELAWEIWAYEMDMVEENSLNRAAVRDDLTAPEREIFGMFVANGESPERATAMIEFIRRPLDQDGDWALVKGGVPIMTYMDQLAEMGV
jgi:hypothetical protein